MRSVPEDPWWLPGLPSPPGAWHRGRTTSGRPFRAPRLDAAEARAVAERVRTTALELRRERRLEEVIRAAARAAGRLARAEDPVGERAIRLLSAELGWPRDLAAETLEGMAALWTEDALQGLVEAELPDPGVLDGFRAGAGSPDRRRRAAGPALLTVVHAQNVPGVAVTAVLRGLLVRSGVLNKAPEGEPGLLALFARALAEEDGLLADSLATTWWPGAEEDPAWSEWLAMAGQVVAYGGEEAVRGVRARLSGTTDLLSYGPKLGVAVVLADACRAGDALRAAAAGVARDVCAYEQQGCVSPRLVHVLGPVQPFAEALAGALRTETARLSRPRPDPAVAVAIRELRAEAEFAAHGAGEPPERRILASEGDLGWTVLVDRRATASTEALPRVVRVQPAPDVAAVLETLAPLEGRIQSVGTAGTEDLDALVEGAFRLRVSRVAPVGSQAWPPFDWRHDGRFQLLPLLRWTDWEPRGPERGASEAAPPFPPE